MGELVRKPASSTASGELTNGAQTIYGAKTFANTVGFTSAITPSGGIVGKTDGIAVEAGKVGERLEKKTTVATAFPGANGGWGDAVFSDATNTLTITPGLWTMSAVGYFSGGSGVDQYYLAIGTTAGAGAVDVVLGDNGVRIQRTASADPFSLVVPNFTVNVTTNTAYRLKLVANYPAGSNPNYTCRLTAIRIA